MDQAVLVSEIKSSLNDLALLYPALTPWAQEQIATALYELRDHIKAPKDLS